MLVKISDLKFINIQKKLLRTWQRKDCINLYVAYFFCLGNTYFNIQQLKSSLGELVKSY